MNKTTATGDPKVAEASSRIANLIEERAQAPIVKTGKAYSIMEPRIDSHVSLTMTYTEKHKIRVVLKNPAGKWKRWESYEISDRQASTIANYFIKVTAQEEKQIREEDAIDPEGAEARRKIRILVKQAIPAFAPQNDRILERGKQDRIEWNMETNGEEIRLQVTATADAKDKRRIERIQRMLSAVYLSGF